MTRRALTISLALLLTAAGLGCSQYREGYERGAQIRTLKVLSRLAISMEAHRGEKGVYPTAHSMNELRLSLREFDDRPGGIDHWGESILVDSGPQEYLLTSTGSDKSGGPEFGGAVRTEGHSITLQNGHFVQYSALADDVARELEADMNAARIAADAKIEDRESKR